MSFYVPNIAKRQEELNLPGTDTYNYILSMEDSTLSIKFGNDDISLEEEVLIEMYPGPSPTESLELKHISALRLHGTHYFLMTTQNNSFEFRYWLVYHDGSMIQSKEVQVPPVDMDVLIKVGFSEPLGPSRYIKLEYMDDPSLNNKLIDPFMGLAVVTYIPKFSTNTIELSGYSVEVSDNGSLHIWFGNSTSGTKVLETYYAPETMFVRVVPSLIINITVIHIHGVHYFLMTILDVNGKESHHLVYQVDGGEIQSRDITSEVLELTAAYIGDSLTGVNVHFSSSDGSSRELILSTIVNGTSTSKSLTMDLFEYLEIDVDPKQPPPMPLGSVGGDPYVFPLHGPVVKLPNCDNFYRLLQIPSTQTVINAAVSRATTDQRAAIRDQTSRVTDYAEVIDDGYFLSQIFVSTGGGGHEDIIINLDPGSAVLSRTDLPWTEVGVRTGQNTTGLLQGTYQARNVQVGPVTLEVRIFANAQIRNEVSVRLPGACPTDTSGLLYRNYRPTLFQLGSLTSTKTQTRYQKSRRALTQKAPVNQYEHAQLLFVQQG